MTRIKLPTAITTSVAALLLASAAVAQTEAASPRDNPGQTVTQPTGSTSTAPDMPKLGDADSPSSLNADQVRDRTAERMSPDAQPAPKLPKSDDKAELPKYSLDADEARQRTAEEIKQETGTGDQSSLYGTDLLDATGDGSSWAEQLRSGLVGTPDARV